MPELPEVETMRRGIQRVVGSRVASVTRVPCTRRPIRVHPPLPRFRERVVDRRIVAVERLGKRVAMALENGYRIVFEPRMTGLVLVADPPSLHHLRFRVDLADGEIPAVWYWDRRGLGSVQLLPPAAWERDPRIRSLGPDALAIGSGELQARLERSRREIKVALLDQQVLAGIGNLYASEILHRAGIHPRRRCDQLRGEDWRSLHAEIGAVLREAIEYEGSTLSDGTYRNALNQSGTFQRHHRVYDRAGQLCLTCGRFPIEQCRQCQRSTFFCRNCQPLRWSAAPPANKRGPRNR